MSYINLLEIIYPVGSLYISSVNTSPSEIVGGIWEQISDTRYLMAANGTRPSCEVGGANSITLTVNQIPSHAHKMREGYSNTVGGTLTFPSFGNANFTANANTWNTGGGRLTAICLLTTQCICGDASPRGGAACILTY